MFFPPLWSDEVEARLRGEARNLDEQRPPKDIRMCTRCVITNQRPRITFDAEGVCSACRYAEMKRNGSIDWAARAKELEALLARHRRARTYDVIVPCSGGKDSASVAWRLKHEHGMNPLCACWAPFLYTDIGRRNMDNFVQSGFDVVTCQPSGIEHRRLARLSLEYYGDPFIPFIFGQLCWPLHVAVATGTSLVMFGEQGELEYGGDTDAMDKPFWDYRDWPRIYQKGATTEKLLQIGRGLGAFTVKEADRVSPFYRLPTDLDVAEVECHWWGRYRPWHPQENLYLATEKTGFEVNDERSQGTYSRYASLDDKADNLHYYFGWLKFGIGRATSDAAHEIRDGDLEREEALALVAKYDGEFPSRYLDECLDYLGIDQAQLGRIIARFRAPHVAMPGEAMSRK